MASASWKGSPWSSCGAISKLLSERLHAPRVARWRRPGLSIETSDYHVDDNQQPLPSLLHSRRHLEERDRVPKSIQQGCCLHEYHDVRTQTQEHLQILPQAQTRSSAIPGSAASCSGLDNFSGVKSPAGSNLVQRPQWDAARRQVRDMPAAVERVLPSNSSYQRARGEAPSIQLSGLGGLEHARSTASEGTTSCRSTGQTSVLEARSCFNTPREPLPILQEERYTCRPRARQFPLLVRYDELTLADQQAFQGNANNEDLHASSLRLTSQEFEVWFQPGPLGVYVADVQTGHVTEVLDGQVKAHGIISGLQLLTLDGEPYSEALLERKVNGSAPYRVVFKQPCDQQQDLGPAAPEAFPCRVPLQTSYVPQTHVLQGCQSFGTHALMQWG